MCNIAIVVPVYNEALGIKTFHNKVLTPELGRLDSEFTIYYVNDGSSDGTLSFLNDLKKNDPRVRVISLSRNFGKELATTAGLHEAKGDAIILMDADGQHPPKKINEFIEKWQSGKKSIIGIRQSNSGEGIVKSAGSKLFYKIFNTSSGVKMIPGTTDYRLIDRAVIEEFKKCGDRSRITRGLIDWLGFEKDYVYFESPVRIAGEASYSIVKLVTLALNSFVSLSIRPLLWLVYTGVATIMGSLLIGAFLVIEHILLNDPLGLNTTGSGYLGVFIMMLVGILMLSQGIVAIYISRIHEQSQNRPLYIIDQDNSNL